MSKLKRRYSWPSSKISKDVMFEVYQVAQETGRPITDIIADAVHSAMNTRFDQNQRQPIGFIQTQQSPRPAA
jgi:hypothetical protein